MLIERGKIYGLIQLGHRHLSRSFSMAGFLAAIHVVLDNLPKNLECQGFKRESPEGRRKKEEGRRERTEGRTNFRKSGSLAEWGTSGGGHLG